LHPGLTVGRTDATPEENVDVLYVNTMHSTMCLEQVKEASPVLPKGTLNRSMGISKISVDTLKRQSSTYIQVSDSGDSSANISLLSNTGMLTCANQGAEMYTPEGYIHFTLDHNKWCNLSNEDDSVSYK